MPAWEWALAATGAGVGPLVVGVLVWAWIYSTKEPPTTQDDDEGDPMTQTSPNGPTVPPDRDDELERDPDTGELVNDPAEPQTNPDEPQE